MAPSAAKPLSVASSFSKTCYERREKMDIQEKVAGKVLYITDQYGEDLPLPEGDLIKTYILNQPGLLVFFKNAKNGDGLMVISEEGSARFYGQITKREAGFISFSCGEHRLLIEENPIYGESAWIGEQNFMNLIRMQKEQEEYNYEQEEKAKRFHSLVQQVLETICTCCEEDDDEEEDDYYEDEDYWDDEDDGDRHNGDPFTGDSL